MSFVSYSQNYEDVILWRALKSIDNGFYIDVGANDPIEDSVTKALYDRGWSGVNIEPLKNNFKELCKNRPHDLNINCAISNQEGSLEIWNSSIRGIATLDKRIAEEYEDKQIKGSWEAVEIKTLDSIFLNINRKEVHFLKIDVEGFEKQVIEGNNWDRNRPWILVIESTKPQTDIESHEDWEHIITAKNYHFVYADGINRFYLAEEHIELKDKFRFPPNIFDDFIKADIGKLNEIISDKDRVINSLNNKIKMEAIDKKNKTDESLDKIIESLDKIIESLYLLENRTRIIEANVMPLRKSIANRLKPKAIILLQHAFLWIKARPRLLNFLIKVISKNKWFENKVNKVLPYARAKSVIKKDIKLSKRASEILEDIKGI